MTKLREALAVAARGQQKRVREQRKEEREDIAYSKRKVSNQKKADAFAKPITEFCQLADKLSPGIRGGIKQFRFRKVTPEPYPKDGVSIHSYQELHRDHIDNERQFRGFELELWRFEADARQQAGGELISNPALLIIAYDNGIFAVHDIFMDEGPVARKLGQAHYSGNDVEEALSALIKFLGEKNYPIHSLENLIQETEKSFKPVFAPSLK